MGSGNEVGNRGRRGKWRGSLGRSWAEEEEAVGGVGGEERRMRAGGGGGKRGVKEDE